MRRLDPVITRRSRLDAGGVEGDVAAAGIEGDFLLGGDVDFVFGLVIARP